MQELVNQNDLRGTAIPRKPRPELHTADANHGCAGLRERERGARVAWRRIAGLDESQEPERVQRGHSFRREDGQQRAVSAIGELAEHLLARYIAEPCHGPFDGPPNGERGVPVEAIENGRLGGSKTSRVSSEKCVRKNVVPPHDLLPFGGGLWTARWSRPATRERSAGLAQPAPLLM